MKVQNQTPLKTSAPGPAAAKSKPEPSRTAAANATSAAKVAKAESPVTPAQTRESARPEISERAKEMSLAKQVAQSAPEIREDRVAKLKEQIAQGKYQVNPEAIADRMIDEHLGM